jgi:hypothetical protein
MTEKKALCRVAFPRELFVVAPYAREADFNNL